jgi:PleD family two-component response regulator
VLLADADLATAQLVAQRLLDGVRCQGPAPRSGWLNLRLSIGVAQHHTDQSVHALICRADQALQLAKASGGDRFTVID